MVRFDKMNLKIDSRPENHIIVLDLDTRIKTFPKRLSRFLSFEWATSLFEKWLMQGIYAIPTRENLL